MGKGRVKKPGLSLNENLGFFHDVSGKKHKKSETALVLD